MNELLSKISSYNIFNYLFPGAVFAILADRAGALDIATGDVATALLLYYFIGMTVSRIGSVVLEPLLRKMKFAVYSDYTDYIRACQDDIKIEVLLEVSNTYRTLAAAFLLLPLTILGAVIADAASLSVLWRHIILVAGLFFLFFVFLSEAD